MSVLPFDVVVPITTDNGKTIWQKIGCVFKNEKEDKKHLMTISIRAIPLKAFAGGEILAYVFPPKEQQQPDPPDLVGEDIPF